MKCPHCLQYFTEEWKLVELEEDNEGLWGVSYCVCDNPDCRRLVAELVSGARSVFLRQRTYSSQTLIRPRGIARSPIPTEVPEEYIADYKEACIVLQDSAKASAALSRRSLQHLLREKASTKNKDLADQIQEVIDNRSLPFELSEALDAVRNIGNFAAHPVKSKSTREIVEVEPGEAEWNLEVLEQLFEHYFVRPAILQRKKEALNKKLADAGKPPMKLVVT